MKGLRNGSFVALLAVSLLTGVRAAPAMEPECPEVCNQECDMDTTMAEYKRCALGDACEGDYECAEAVCQMIATGCQLTYDSIHWNGFCIEPEEQYECWFPGITIED